MSARLVYAASLALHVAVGSAVASTRPAPARRTVVVEVRRARPRTPPPAPTPAPAPAPTPAPPAPVAAPAARATPSPARSSPPRAAPRAAPANAAPATGPGLAVGAPHDFGVALGNDTGGNGGGGGGEGPATPAPAPRAAHDEEACEGAPTRPRVISMEQPEYPDAAREAEIEGRVRVELHVDETGAVTSARVLEGLGHGLDEAALAAARAARFEPATRCGRPVEATFTVGVRFAL